MNDYSFSIKFILETRRERPDSKYPIYVRCIKGGLKSEMHLYEYVRPEMWDADRGRVMTKDPNSRNINHKISTIEKLVNEVRWELEKSGRPFSAKTVLQIVKGGNKATEPRLFEFFDLHIKEIIEKGLHSRSVINHYKQARTKLYDYLKSIGKQHLFLKELTRSHIDGFEHFLLTKKVPVIDKPLNRNTANRYLVKVRAVMNKAILKELIVKSPFTGFVIHEVQSVSRTFLTEQELQRIKDHPLSGLPSLYRVRDIFMFSVYTGLRFTDALGLKDHNVYLDHEGTLWISRGQEKTGNPIQIPMLKPAVDIYYKYAEERKQTGFVLPRLSNQKVNAHLKEIARLTGIDKELTHHVARHTFATTILLDNGIDIKTVSQFLGHMDLKSTQIYAKVTKKNLASVAKRINLSIPQTKKEIKDDFERISQQLAKGIPINYN